jgi:hypothetical protein
MAGSSIHREIALLILAFRLIVTEDLESDHVNALYPPFNEATANRSISWGWWSEDDHEWVALFEKLYNANLPVRGNAPQIEGTVKQGATIKKIMHQVWLGGKPMPAQFATWRKTCIDLHPDWVHILWTEKEADELVMLNRSAYDDAENIGEKSDALRLTASPICPLQHCNRLVQ